MSDNNSGGKEPRNNKKRNEERAEESMKSLRKMLFFGIISIVGVIFLINLFSKQAAPSEILFYPVFVEQVKAGNVMEMQVANGQHITGLFNNPVMVEDLSILRFKTSVPIANSDYLITLIEDYDITVSGTPPAGGLGRILIVILPGLLFIAFWIWIIRAMQGAGGRAFQFSKSKAKLIKPDKDKKTFADVAGAEEAKASLEEIVDFLRDPQKYKRLGGKIPKGVLLVGPPGTGKTLLARAVAGEAERPFFQLSGSDFVEMFVGVGAGRVRNLFEQGKAYAPCIIFIDEIDAVGRHRGSGIGGGHDEREQTLNALLVEMDGFEANEGVIVLAATNRPDVLDPALLRPGRFDRQVVVDMPDVKGREGILGVHSKNLPLAMDVNISLIARGTPNMSGADLENICNEAALIAARRNGNSVTMVDFEKAKDKVMIGAERRSLVLSDDDRRLTAYHEAGHAVVGLSIPGQDPVHKVSIVPTGRALGITVSLPADDSYSLTKEKLKGKIAMCLGGRAAEELVFGPDMITTGAQNDIDQATSLTRRMVTQWGMSEEIGPVAIGTRSTQPFLGREMAQQKDHSEFTQNLVDAEIKRLNDEALNTARSVLKREKELLDIIAQALLERETLNAKEIDMLMRGEELPELIIEEPEKIKVEVCVDVEEVT